MIIIGGVDAAKTRSDGQARGLSRTELFHVCEYCVGEAFSPALSSSFRQSNPPFRFCEL
jgi:hypothetical protein